MLTKVAWEKVPECPTFGVSSMALGVNFDDVNSLLRPLRDGTLAKGKLQLCPLPRRGFSRASRYKSVCDGFTRCKLTAFELVYPDMKWTQ